MSLRPDWAGVVALKTERWEAMVQQQQLHAQLPRPRSVWRRRAGTWLVQVGGWLSQCGARLAESESSPSVSVSG